MNAIELINTLKDAINHKERILIVGAPGEGKSEIVSFVAKKLEADLITDIPSVADPTDAKGFPFRSSCGTHAEFLPYGNLYKAYNAKKLTLFFADDLGQASESVQKAYMQLILTGGLNGHRMPDNVVWIGATNDIGQKAGVSGLIEPLKSRWHSIIHYQCDFESWKLWALDNGMPIEVIAYLGTAQGQLSSFQPTRALTVSPSPRGWSFVGKRWARGVRNEELDAGSIGAGTAREFYAFVEMAKDAPSLDDIVLNPESAKIPEKPSVKYLVCTGLAFKANKDNFHQIFKYLKRLEQPHRVMTIKDASQKNPSVMQTKEFVRWVSDEGKDIIRMTATN